jgi:hypothetical protein
MAVTVAVDRLIDSDRLAMDKLIVTLILRQPLSTPITDKIGMKC